MDVSEAIAPFLRYRHEGLLAQACQQSVIDGAWHVCHTELAQLVVEGSAVARRLRLSVDLSLAGSSPEEQLQLRLSVCSAVWAHTAERPQASEALSEAPSVSEDPAAELPYEITGISVRNGAEVGEGFWMKYVNASCTTPRVGTPPAGRPLPELLLETVAAWLRDVHQLNTVAGAVRCAISGPVGCFGPVQRIVLERTGQADIEVEVTALGEASDAPEQGGEPTLLLSLYGDRHGAWLLHRRILQARNNRRNEPPLPPLYNCDVLVADTGEELVHLTGLGRTEKRLFQAAGVLGNDTLYEHYASQSAQEPAPHWEDLSGIADRQRRYVQAIVALIRDGRLNAPDLDILLRTARQLGRNVR